MIHHGEKIVAIEEVHGFKPEDNYSSYEGYRISTSRQNILILINEGQDCCEEAGYLTANDDVSEFVGGDLLSIKTVDGQYAKRLVDLVGDLHEGDAVFVHVETSKGLLEFALYNAHNGYYGHSYRIQSAQLSETGCI